MRIAWVCVLIACSDRSPAPTPARVPSPIGQLAVGRAHTCALFDDGTAACWGANGDGQLGVADRDRSLAPVAVPGLAGAVELGLAGNTSCARFADGAVDCWGWLGMASTSRTPVRVTTEIAQLAGRCFRTRAGGVQCLTDDAQLVDIAISDVVDLAASRADRGCAVVRSGEVQCWHGGEPFSTGITKAAQVVATDRGGCALLQDGSVPCWTAFERTSVSPRATTLTGARGLVAAGGERICARTATTILCWKDREDKKRDLALPPATLLAVADHACFSRGARAVACFGNGTEGQLGNGWSDRRLAPVRVGGLEDVVELAGAHHGQATCARTRDGRAACWGNLPTAPTATPRAVPGDRIVQLVDSTTIRVVTETGSVRAADRGAVWGSGTIDLATKRDGVASASEHCFITSAGRLQCWRGYATADPDDPQLALVPKIDDAVQVISLGERGPACARRRSGPIACFRPGSDEIEPIAIDDAVELAMADSGRCAIRADRTLWCWGSTATAIFPPRPAIVDVPPTQIPIGQVVAVAMRDHTACAVRASGRVACWGANREGQLGDGTMISRDRPADVMGITDAIDVHVGSGFACALHRGGTVSCWGASDRGQVGTYVMSDVSEPVSVIWP